ncbi:MAG: hypothetical protein RBT06_04890 [Smithellaceae bacterium]|jgi:F0F1-type ATP synthase membrane subunit c/vacuolar-type H+-ATPase subunit K|nr:hypothetical protein [Smithellaceae bacterium]
MDSAMLLIGLLIGVICGVFVYDDAKKRGMNALGWSIFIFLILIIGLPMYALMRKPLLNQNAGSDKNSVLTHNNKEMSILCRRYS